MSLPVTTRHDSHAKSTGRGLSGMVLMVTGRALRRSLARVSLACLGATGAYAESGSGTEVHIVDLNLRTVVEKALGVQPGYPIRRSDAARLLALDVSDNAYDVLELGGLEYAVNLERLDLRGNRIVDIGPLAGLHRLMRVDLADNAVADISPLVANEGFGPGDQVFLVGNPLSTTSVSEGIPALESKGAFVGYLDDHGDTIGAATALALGATSTGGIDRASDVDYFGFEVSSASDVAVFTTGADTQGELRIGLGPPLASDSASGAFGNFLVRQYLQPGQYYVRVTGARGPYAIHTVEGAPVSFPDANLRSLVADALGDAASDGLTSSELATLTGTLNAGGQQISNLSGLEFAVNLTDLKLGRNRLRNVTELSSLISLVHLDLEDNAIRDVAPLVANLGLDEGDQILLGGNRLSDDSENVVIPALQGRGVFVGYTDDHGDDLDSASPLMLGSSSTASIYPADDRDVFRLRVPAATDVVVYTTGGMDTVGALYDAEGRQLAANDNAGGRTDFMIARTLDAGDYFVRVRGADESVRGTYVLEAREDPNASVLPDVDLRAVVADALSKSPDAEITAVDLATMTSLSAAGNRISDLTGLELAVELTHIDLASNRVRDVTPLAGLTALTDVRLGANAISDVSPLVMNVGLGEGDRVFLQGNPLSATAANDQVPALTARGVAVVFADGHGNHRSSATALALGGSSPGSIHHPSDHDFFRLDLATETDVAVLTIGDADLVGTLSDTRSVQVSVGDYRRARAGFFFRATLGPGSYYVKVDGDNDSLGAYVIHALEDEPVQIPDEGLHARVAQFFSVATDASVTTGDLAWLQVFDGGSAGISNLAGIDGAFNLRHLALRHNKIVNLEPLSGMTRLAELNLEGNDISDIAALLGNGGLGPGDKVILAGNPLSQTALDVQLPALEERGVFVGFADDHGDRTGTATLLAPGTSATGTLSTVDDEDVFRLQLPEATDVAIYTTGSTDTAGRLAGAGSSRLAADSHSGQGDNFVIRRRLGAGVYHVTVSGSRGFAGVGPYVLHATVGPRAAPANITVLRDGSSLVVTWDPVPTDLAGGPVTRYRVLATPSDGGEPIECTASPAAGCTIVGLADGVDYTVTVRAINAVGFGPIGTFAPTPEPIAADMPLTSFWRGWRLSLAAPAEEEPVDD